MGIVNSAERAYMRFHESVYVRTDGRIGARLIGVPTLLLRTKGRRSGQIRTVALIYARDGGSFVLVASNHGLEVPPAWLLNIGADPHVEIQVGRRRSAATARVVGRGDADYPRLWKLVNDGNHHRYDSYQARTARAIPLVVLDPA